MTNVYLLLEYIAMININKREFRVLLHILKKINKPTFSIISQANICEELDMTKPDVSKAIKDLVYRDIIELNPDSEKKSRVSLRLKQYTDEELQDLIFECVDNREEE